MLLVFNWFSLNLTCKPEPPSNEINDGIQFIIVSIFCGFYCSFSQGCVATCLPGFVGSSHILSGCFGHPGCFGQLP